MARATSKLWCVGCCSVATLLTAAETPQRPITAPELAQVRQAEADREAVVNRVLGAVVCVFDKSGQGGGSGVVYDRDGLTLTNHHVVAAAGPQGWAGLADGKRYRWRLMGTDPGGDLAVLQLEGEAPFLVAPLGDSRQVQAGDLVMAMGNPFALAEDLQPSVTLGVVSGINRYQRGTDQNLLVYGNCIQVDTSINPGNSGGPLFDLQGRVIGINGRISAQDRGRVNVGVGYAISMEQARTFLPELLAGRTVRHGTLDAVFSNRGPDVVCTRINLDSIAAEAGLQLGDRLVSFEGVSILDANQFTNLISMYPAGWPVRLVYRRGDAEKTCWLRLLPLDYGEPRQPIPPAEEGPQQPAAAIPPELNTNRGNADRVLRRWREGQTADASHDSNPAVLWHDDVHRDGRLIGQQQVVLTRDGQFSVAYSAVDESDVAGAAQPFSPQWSVTFDGDRYFRYEKGDPANAGNGRSSQTVAPDLALAEPLVLQIAVLAARFGNGPFAHCEEFLLDGADKAQHRRAYRLRWSHAEAPPVMLWLSVGEQRLEHELLKAGLHPDSPPWRPSVVYQAWREVHGFHWPDRRLVVSGLAETPSLELVTRGVTPLETIPETLRRSDPAGEGAANDAVVE